VACDALGVFVAETLPRPKSILPHGLAAFKPDL